MDRGTVSQLLPLRASTIQVHAPSGWPMYSFEGEPKTDYIARLPFNHNGQICIDGASWCTLRVRYADLGNRVGFHDHLDILDVPIFRPFNRKPHIHMIDNVIDVVLGDHFARQQDWNTRRIDIYELGNDSTG